MINCLELYEVDPALREDEIHEYCDNCVRVAKIFSKVDPFKDYIYKKQYPDNTLDLGEGITIELEKSLTENIKLNL